MSVPAQRAFKTQSQMRMDRAEDEHDVGAPGHGELDGDRGGDAIL